jgi:hypothetical protein
MLILFEDTFASFFKDKKVIKKSPKSRKQGFSSLFCLLIEGSGSGSEAGSVQVNYGSGSRTRRPKTIQILRIRIQLRIRNTASNFKLCNTFIAVHLRKQRLLRFISGLLRIKVPVRSTFVHISIPAISLTISLNQNISQTLHKR